MLGQTTDAWADDRCDQFSGRDLNEEISRNPRDNYYPRCRDQASCQRSVVGRPEIFEAGNHIGRQSRRMLEGFVVWLSALATGGTGSNLDNGGHLKSGPLQVRVVSATHSQCGN